MMQVVGAKMTAEQFVYWLQGLLELGEVTSISEKQTQMIKTHLVYVFNTNPFGLPPGFKMPESQDAPQSFC